MDSPGNNSEDDDGDNVEGSYEDEEDELEGFFATKQSVFPKKKASGKLKEKKKRVKSKQHESEFPYMQASPVCPLLSILQPEHDIFLVI